MRCTITNWLPTSGHVGHLFDTLNAFMGALSKIPEAPIDFGGLALLNRIDLADLEPASGYWMKAV